MANQATAGTTLQGADSAHRAIAPDITVRIVGAMLALSIAAVHIADQGGVTAFTSPNWIGWGYRLIEVGGVLTALVLLVPLPAWPIVAWGRWAAAALLGVGPFLAYVLSRTVGVPGRPGR